MHTVHKSSRLRWGGGGRWGVSAPRGVCPGRVYSGQNSWHTLVNCENITFLQLRLRTVKIKNKKYIVFQSTWNIFILSHFVNLPKRIMKRKLDWFVLTASGHTVVNIQSHYINTLQSTQLIFLLQGLDLSFSSIFKPCSHITFAFASMSKSLSKFIIASMVIQKQTQSMGSEAILGIWCKCCYHCFYYLRKCKRRCWR